MTVRNFVSALSAPEIIQIASNGIWENALSLSTSSPSSWYLLEQWLTANTAVDIGFELLFKHVEFGTVLIGFRLPNDRTSREIVRELADVVLVRRWNAPRDGLDCLEQTLRVSEPLFPITGPDVIELGVFNQWLSIGPITIFRQARDSQNVVSEWPILTKTLPGALHPILLEVSYRLPVRHWIGVQVSDERQGLQIISEGKLATARSLAPSREHLISIFSDDDLEP